MNSSDFFGNSYKKFKNFFINSDEYYVFLPEFKKFDNSRKQVLDEFQEFLNEFLDKF